MHGVYRCVRSSCGHTQDTFIHDRPSAGSRIGPGAAKLAVFLLLCFAALAVFNTGAFGAPGDITNTARVTFNGGVEVFTNQVTDSLEPVVDCSVTKTVDKPRPMEGETVTYIINATNTGGNTATGVVVTDTLPDGVTYSGSNPSPTSFAGGVASWNIGNLAPGAGVSISVNAVVDDNNSHAGTTVTNTAQITQDQLDTTPANNTAAADILVRTPAEIQFLRYAPSVPGAEDVNFSISSYSPDGSESGPFVDMGPPTVPGSGPIDLGSPVPVVAAESYHDGEPLFVRVTDRDQNLDPTVAETVVVILEGSADSGTDRETVRIRETGPDTGVFTGYIMSTTSDNDTHGNGTLAAKTDTQVSASYSDPLDGPGAAVSASALVDPYGVVFDSSTGRPVDGAVISLVRVTAGGSSPAVVYGDDGVSSFPSSVVSGGTVTDSSGRQYDFPDGAFRFPLIAPGDYRLEITPPDGYRAPSTVADSVLQNLPGGPFAIVPGSRGGTFNVDGGSILRIDIPVDPLTHALYLAKRAGVDTAAIGDFVPYNLSVENTSDVPVTGIVVTDRLPVGFRYRDGSAKRDGSVSVNPTISNDGQTLVFKVGTLGAGKKVSIDYVAEVSAGAHTGKAVNRALASGDNASSLPASATVDVKEDLFRSKCIIVGRVIADNCENRPVKENDGVGNVRIYLEDGTFAITDKNGMYHFEGVNPGTHVVQLDRNSLPARYKMAFCEHNSRFAGTPYSQFVDLKGGTMWRADFHVESRPRVRGEIKLRLESMRAGGTILYDAYLSGGTVPVSNLRFTLLLPDGVEYIDGTSTMDGKEISPSVMGGVLTYRLGEMPRVWRRHISLKAAIKTIFTAKDEASLVTKGLLTFNTPAARNRRTPLVETKTPVRFKDEITLDAAAKPLFESFSYELTEYGKKQVEKVKKQLEGRRVRSIVITGHTDALRIRPRSRHIFKNNDELSLARAKSVGRYLAELLGLSPDMIKTFGMGSRKPVATNMTPEGRTRNRRVEITILSEAISNDTAVADDSVRVVTHGARPGESGPESARKDAGRVEEAKNLPEINRGFVDKLRGTSKPLGWVWPEEGYLPSSPGIKIAIMHRPGVLPKLLLNGRPVSKRNFEQTVTNSSGTLAVSLWRGVDLAQGDNLLVGVTGGADGSGVFRISRKIHYSGPPVSARVIEDRSRLVADGITPPVIAVRLADRDGYPARRGVVGKFSVMPPYMPLEKKDAMQRSPLTGQEDEDSRFVVGDDGVVLIRLAPTSRSGKAVVNLYLMDGEKTVDAWLSPKDREWVLVGLAEGTMGYNTLSGHAENLAASGAEDRIYKDGRVAFFAKGRIKGEWLLTVAADTTREKAVGDDELFRTIDPDSYYTLYGDATGQDYEAPSRKKLYVKLEKNQFYALFGDYSTGLTVTELSRYTRNGTGFKSEYDGDRFSYTAFASSTDKGFVKDEIRGDGTSGLYRLSHSDIVANSETVTIETRDRFKSEKILSSKTLMRHVDYSIDYSTGELYFREPVFSRDEKFNPVYIVVDYETSGGGLKNGMNYGGRGAVKLMDGKAEIGVSHIHEGTDGARGRLTGVDAEVNIGASTRIRAEYATSNRQDGSATVDGDAYLAEVTHQSKKFSGRLYVREEEPGFGLGQQRETESGTRKIGGEGNLQVTSALNADAEAYRQENLATGAERYMAELGMSYSSGKSTFHTGLRHAEDRFSDGTTNRSDQALVGASTKTMDDRMTLSVEHEQSISSDHNASSDFPTRTMLGADYQVSKKTSLFAQQEFTSGRDEDTNQTRLGLKTVPWSGGILNSTLGREYNENGTRVFADMGLAQKWKINDLWNISGGLEHSRTLKDPGSTPLNVNVPPASGTADDNDFTALSIGAAYTPETWSWDGRAEFRHSGTEDRWGFVNGVYGEPAEGIGLSCGMSLFMTRRSTGTETTDGSLRFGFAHRPRNARWIILDKLELRYEDETGTSSPYRSRRIINNLNANFRPDSKIQLSLQYGAKYVLDTINGDDYSGYTDLIGIEGRYDITKRFDAGIYGGLLHSWETSRFDYRTGLSLGYDLAKNMWISLGYNLAGFTDRDFSAADFTAKGPFVQFRMKFDQGSVKEAARLLGEN